MIFSRISLKILIFCEIIIVNLLLKDDGLPGMLNYV